MSKSSWQNFYLLNESWIWSHVCLYINYFILFTLITYLLFRVWTLSSHLITAAGQRELLSSGSGRFATGSPCGAILWSLLIGWSGDGPARRRTASGGCRRCRRLPRRSDGRGGWGWWCAPACCFYSALWGRKTLWLSCLQKDLTGVNVKLSNWIWECLAYLELPQATHVGSFKQPEEQTVT